MHYYRTSIRIAGVLAIIIIAILWPARDLIISIFTQDEEIVKEMQLAWNLFLVFLYCDITQCVAVSAVRAAG